MQVSVENTSNLGRRISVTVPAEHYDNTYRGKLVKAAQSARVEGFRKGKVPEQLLIQRYGDQIHAETVDELLGKTLKDSLNEQNLLPVDAPVIDSLSAFAGQPMVYSASFEVYPEIDLIDFSTLALEKVTTTITDEDINKTLDNIRKQFANWVEVDRPAKMEDKVEFDFTGTVGGTAFPGGSANNYQLVLGSKQFIPGFEEQMVGLSANDARDITVTFPETYQEKSLAGQEAVFAIKVHKVFEAQLPDVDGPFLEKMGVKDGSIDTLKDNIKKHMELEVKKFLEQRLKQQVFEKLVEKHSFELPQTLINKEIQAIHNQQHGHAHDEHHHHDDHHISETEQAEWQKQAEKRVSLSLLVSKIVTQFGIKADFNRVKSMIEEMSTIYDDPSAFMNWIMQDRNRMMHFHSQVLEDQVVEFIVEKATVTERSVPYEEVSRLESTTEE